MFSHKCWRWGVDLNKIGGRWEVFSHKCWRWEVGHQNRWEVETPTAVIPSLYCGTKYKFTSNTSYIWKHKHNCLTSTTLSYRLLVINLRRANRRQALSRTVSAVASHGGLGTSHIEEVHTDNNFLVRNHSALKKQVTKSQERMTSLNTIGSSHIGVFLSRMSRFLVHCVAPVLKKSKGTLKCQKGDPFLGKVMNTLYVYIRCAPMHV